MDTIDRKARADTARLQLRKLARLIELWEQGLSDAAIADQLGWATTRGALGGRRSSTVYHFRRLLRLQQGNASGRARGQGAGRWRAAHALMHLHQALEAP